VIGFCRPAFIRLSSKKGKGGYGGEEPDTSRAALHSRSPPCSAASFRAAAAAASSREQPAASRTAAAAASSREQPGS